MTVRALLGRDRKPASFFNSNPRLRAKGREAMSPGIRWTGDLRLSEDTDSEQTGWKGSLLLLKVGMLNCETVKRWPEFSPH